MDKLEEIKQRYDSPGCIPETIGTQRGDINWLISKIERLTNENEEMVKCSELEEKYTNEVIAEHGMEYEKEIEQLRKEKEWLIEHYATRRYSHRPDKTKETIAKEIVEQMQQELKEK